MSEHSAYYEAVCTGYWADHDPGQCPCRGRGWFLSEVDTWHRCPVHGAGKGHPEDDRDESEEPVAPGALVAPQPLPDIEWGDDDIPF